MAQPQVKKHRLPFDPISATPLDCYAVGRRYWESLTRAALSTGARVKSDFLSVYMSKPYPLVVPDELKQEIRSAAQRTGLSMADIMRQSMKAGLPKVVEQFGRSALKSFTAEEARLAYQTPNPEFDDPERHCARLPKRRPRGMKARATLGWWLQDFSTLKGLRQGA